jgi:hypothetical protein
LVACAFALPALVFIFKYPAIARVLAATRRERSVLLGGVILALAAGFLSSGSAAAFTAEIAIVLAMASIVASRPKASLPPRALAAASAVVLVLCTIVRLQSRSVDDMTRGNRDRALLCSVLRKHPSVIIVDHENPAYRRLYSPAILTYLAGHSTNVRYSSRAPNVFSEPIFDASPEGLARIDQGLRAVAALARARRHLREDIYSESSGGQIKDTSRQATPSGRGVLLFYPAAGPSGPIGSIVVLSGSSYTFEHAIVRPGDRLSFLEAKILPMGSSARGTVTIEISDGERIVSSDDLLPAPPVGPPAWAYRSIPIPVSTRATVRIRFAATSPSGQNIGDWVAFGSPAIVGP